MYRPRGSDTGKDSIGHEIESDPLDSSRTGNRPNEVNELYHKELTSQATGIWGKRIEFDLSSLENYALGVSARRILSLQYLSGLNKFHDPILKAKEAMIQKTKPDPFRRIVDVRGNTITVDVPDYLRYRKVEVVLLPFEEDSPAPTKGKTGPNDSKNFLDRFNGAIPDFPDVDPEGDFEDRQGFE